MRAAAALLALLASPVAAAPARVVSLNLCTDELALLLAAPGQLASVSRLGADPLESVLAARARGLPVNRGRLDGVIALAPDLVLSSGGDRTAAAAARRLGIAALEVPMPASLAGMRANVRAVAAALGRDAAGAVLLAAMDAQLGQPPAVPRTALLVGGGGVTIAADGLAAAWLRHAGLVQQTVPRGQVSLERLLSKPPQVLVLSRYRMGQASNNQAWLGHPAVTRLSAATRRLTTDGRAWTCLGPPVAWEVARLRASLPAEGQE